MRSKLSASFVLAIALLCFASLSFGEDTCSSSVGNLNPDDPADIHILSISGEVVAGDYLRVSITPGPIASQSIRVYSEPSHTPLVFVIDPEFKASPIGESWLKAVKSDTPHATTITTTLPAGQPAVQIPARPTTDHRIAVYVSGEWPDGTEEERLVADGAVGSGGFSFSVWRQPPKNGTKIGGNFKHCCSGGSCSEMCVYCADSIFSCCLTPCCSIYCGWQIPCCSG